MTLVEFLRARLNEDEQTAQACSGDGQWTAEDIASIGPNLGVERRQHMARHDPARVLAEVEAKRRIVKAFESNNNYELYRGCGDDCEWGALDYALKALALPYADHPDYREEWRP